MESVNMAEAIRLSTKAVEPRSGWAILIKGNLYQNYYHKTVFQTKSGAVQSLLYYSPFGHALQQLARNKWEFTTTGEERYNWRKRKEFCKEYLLDQYERLKEDGTIRIVEVRPQEILQIVEQQK